MRLIKIFLLAAGALVVSTVGVRARVVGPGITLRVLEVLKGSYDRPSLTVAGQIRDYRSDPGRRPPYEQIDCVGRVLGCGSCFAQSYKDGAEYLLLLKGGTPYWAPLSPTNEGVSGADDPWVVWVRRHLERGPLAPLGRAPAE